MNSGDMVNTTHSSLAFTTTTTSSSAATTTLIAVTTTVSVPSVMSNLIKLQLALMLSIGLIGSFGNFLVLSVLTKRKHRSKTSSVLLLNLAVCDSLVSSLCIPVDVISLIVKHWIFGPALCRVIYPFQTSLPIVSSYTLLFMLLERNMIFSNHIRTKLRSKTVKFLALLTWALSTSMVLPYSLKLHVVGTGDQATCEEAWSNDSYSKIYTVSLSVVEYLIPIVFIIYFVVRIISYLRREQTLVKEGLLGLGRRSSRRRIRSQRRLAVIFMVMVITYASLKLPNNVFWQWLEFGGSGLTEDMRVVHVFVGLCAYSTCATDPFILILMSSEFRKDLRETLCRCARFCKLSNDDKLSSIESEGTAMMTIGTFRSTLRRAFSSRLKRPPQNSCQTAQRTDLPETANEAQAWNPATFKDPERIPMTSFHAISQGNTTSTVSSSE